jgi:hypothetical protein
LVRSIEVPDVVRRIRREVQVSKNSGTIPRSFQQLLAVLVLYRQIEV